MKYPLVRKRLVRLWREARKTMAPVAAWASIVEDPEKRASYTSIRGHGGFVRAEWDEVTEIIAAANAYTSKRYGPGSGDRVFADPSNVDGFLRGRIALSVVAGWDLHVLL